MTSQQLAQQNIHINSLNIGQVCKGYWPQIQQNGWSIVNAPRPIPGELLWTSIFRHGIFYAAGPIDQFKQVWCNLDAWPVIVITNGQIVDKLNSIASQRNINLEAKLAAGHFTIARLASQYHLPYVDDARPFCACCGSNSVTAEDTPLLLCNHCQP